MENQEARASIDPQGADNLRQGEDRFRLLVEDMRDYAIVMLDPDGIVLTWNAGAQRFLGYAADEIVGAHFSRFYTTDALARGQPARELERATQAGSFEDEGWRVRKDGSQIWANVVITAMRDSGGRLVGFSEVTRDLTQRRHHEEALRQSEDRFRLLVEGVAEYAIFMLDVNGRVATWNVGAQRIKGYTADEIVGQHFSVFYPLEERESGWPEHELTEAAAKGSFVDNGWRLRRDGTRFWANVTITALRDDDGRLVGFAKLTRDMTESRRAEAIELESERRKEVLEAERDARIAAQRATRVKDDFLATLSHELRTPLSAILGWTQVLLKTALALPPVEQRRAIEVIDRNARAQVRLIDDLLDLSRIKAGKMRLELLEHSLQDIVRAAVESIRPTAAAREVRVTALFDDSPVTVSADGGRLQQVVWNLLTNAVKFTPAGGQVQVLLQRVGTHVELSVSDSGIGISADFLPHVFDRFSQQDSSKTRGHGGLGLGLAISKQLVELHGGTIRATSNGEGQGARFVVELPVIDAGGADRPRTQALPGHDAAAGPRLDGAHVFIVDDEPDARHLLQRILEDHGATVSAFESADDVLEALRSARPTVLVSDIGMPRMDGHQLIRALRAGEARDSRIPALALTAFAREEDRKLALLSGYQAHLAKPFDVVELLGAVARLAGRGADPSDDRA